MAEGVFRHLVEEAGLGDKITVDSAGTGSWHVGEKAHSGTRRVLRRHSIDYSGRARQVTTADMADGEGADVTYVIAMDASNMRDLRRRYGDHPRLHRLLNFASQNEVRDVPDPYYNGNFEYVYDLVQDGCQGLLAAIREEWDL